MLRGWGSVKLLKRLFDIVVAVVLLVLLSPLMVLIAIMIRLKLGTSVVFIQQRPGLQAKSFYLCKFRTMAEVRDGNGDLLPDGMRLTSLGKFLRRFSLDELPQLINVIKGDISLVGPRPLLMEYLPLYTAEQTRRHEVRPGITGWAQVNGRNAISWEEKFALDVWYVDNWSFWLDMKILWLTFIKVVRAEGISQQGQATVERFMGSD